MSAFTVAGVRIGKVGPLGPNAVPSGIDKVPAMGPLMARAGGFDGDEHGDGTVQLPGVMRHAERAVQARMAK